MMRTQQGRALATLGALVGAGYALVWSWALTTQTYNIYGSLAIVPIIVAINLLLIARVCSRHHEEWLPWVLVLGLCAKFLGTFARYYVAYVVYSGNADAERYNVYASYQHKWWRQGKIVWDFEGKQGTQITELITTFVYVFIGGSPLAGFFVFASFAFWGVYLTYRAFVTAIPLGDHKRYALLLFFLPSLLYWPSSIGKESWLMLFIGVSALGAARLFARESGALLLLLAGGIGLAAVRPHIAVLFFAAIFAAQLFRPADGTTSGVLSKVAGLLVLGGAGLVLANASAQFLGIEDISYQAVTETIDWSAGQTQQGGSEFTPVPLTQPHGVVVAFVTILFRPFPFEAHNIQMVVQSLEGLFLLALTLMGWRRLAQIPRYLRRNPFLVFAIVYLVGYVLAFAGFGNFGILARQRVLVLPFFLMLLALPRPVSSILENLPVRTGSRTQLPSENPVLVGTVERHRK